MPLAGCLETRSGRPEHGARPVVLGAHPVTGLDGPVPDHWQRVFVGTLPHPALAGYVRSKETREDDRVHLVHWLYDAQMNLVGVTSDNGRTTRFDHLGGSRYMGSLTLDRSCLAVFDYAPNPEESPVRFMPMPEPKD